MNRVWPLLLPELRRFPAAQQNEALQAARKTSLDIVELVAMAAGLVAATALTRYAVPEGVATRLAAAFLNFIVSLPLVALLLGPFHIRRLRRGLRELLQRRERP